MTPPIRGMAMAVPVRGEPMALMTRTLVLGSLVVLLSLIGWFLNSRTTEPPTAGTPQNFMDSTLR